MMQAVIFQMMMSKYQVVQRCNPVPKKSKVEAPWPKLVPNEKNDTPASHFRDPTRERLWRKKDIENTYPLEKDFTASDELSTPFQYFSNFLLLNWQIFLYNKRICIQFRKQHVVYVQLQGKCKSFWLRYSTLGYACYHQQMIIGVYILNINSWLK